MTKSQVITVMLTKTTGSLPIYPNKRYQMLIDSFGSIQFRDLETGNYLPIGLKEVE